VIHHQEPLLLSHNIKPGHDKTIGPYGEPTLVWIDTFEKDQPHK